MKYKCIIFDCDGVLVDSEVIHIAEELRYLAEIGLKYEYEEYLSRFVGLSVPDFDTELSQDCLIKTGEKLPLCFRDQLNARVWPRIENELKAIKDVALLANQFSGKVAVASSSPLDLLRRKLSITNLVDLFSSHIYSADHVSNGKPAPDLFLYASEILDVKPNECVVIEDSVNGIKASVAAGMTPIGFIGGGHASEDLKLRLFDAGAKFVTYSHAEIAEYLRKT